MGGKGSGGYRKNALPRDKNPSVQATDPTNVDPDVNDRALKMGMELVDLPEIDLGDPVACRDRLDEFLAMCRRYQLRPQMKAMCVAFNNIDRREFLRICKGDANAIRRKGVTDKSLPVLQKGYSLLEMAWEANFDHMKGNPVGQIFVAKNHYDYTDTTVQVTQHIDSTVQLATPEEIQEKYLKQAGRPAPIEIDAVVEVVPDSEAPRLSDSDGQEEA